MGYLPLASCCSVSRWPALVPLPAFSSFILHGSFLGPLRCLIRVSPGACLPWGYNLPSLSEYGGVMVFTVGGAPLWGCSSQGTLHYSSYSRVFTISDFPEFAHLFLSLRGLVFVFNSILLALSVFIRAVFRHAGPS